MVGETLNLATTTSTALYLNHNIYLEPAAIETGNYLSLPKEDNSMVKHHFAATLPYYSV